MLRSHVTRRQAAGFVSLHRLREEKWAGTAHVGGKARHSAYAQAYAMSMSRKVDVQPRLILKLLDARRTRLSHADATRRPQTVRVCFSLCVRISFTLFFPLRVCVCALIGVCVCALIGVCVCIDWCVCVRVCIA
jgi:hypothetical protein